MPFCQQLSACRTIYTSPTKTSNTLPPSPAPSLPPSLQKLRGSTGFTPVEVFRKYLWFLLRERQFDTAAVEDMVLLKTVLGLTDDQVGGGVHFGGTLSWGGGLVSWVWEGSTRLWR